MELIKAIPFQLAIYKKGSDKSGKLAICLPGRLDTKDYAHMRSHVDFLACKGYLAVSFDPPGTWESPGDLALYTVENYLQAIDAVIEFYGNKPTIVLGHSRGGSMAMLAGIKSPYITHIIAVMSHYGPSEKPKETSGVRVSYRDLPPGVEESREKKRFDLPVSYFDDRTQYVWLETCPKPKLFFLGKRDTMVLPKDVRETYEIAAEPKRLVELDSEHDYRKNPQIVERVNSATEEFLRDFQ